MIQALKSFGCNVEEGLTRCLNNESFYLMLVNKLIASTDLSKLGNALEKDDLDTAFTESHALKGVFANLAITPIYEVLSELTEHLRARERMDYGPLFAKVSDLFDKLKALN